MYFFSTYNNNEEVLTDNISASFNCNDYAILGTKDGNIICMNIDLKGQRYIYTIYHFIFKYTNRNRKRNRFIIYY